MPDENPLNQDKLQEELKKYQEAIKAEYEASTKDNPDDVEEYTQEFFKRNINQAAAQIVWLSLNAESETVRLSSSKYIVERALKQSETDKDPVKALIESLTKPAAETTT